MEESGNLTRMPHMRKEVPVLPRTSSHHGLLQEVRGGEETKASDARPSGLLRACSQREC